MNKGTCLVCFTVNVKIFDIKNTHLQFVYEVITDIKIQTDSYCLCYICLARLQQCDLLYKQAANIKRSRQDNSNEVKHKSVVQLSILNLANTTLPFHHETINQEPDVKVETPDYLYKDDVENNLEVKCETVEEPVPSCSYTDELNQEKWICTVLKDPVVEVQPEGIKDENEGDYKYISRDPEKPHDVRGVRARGHVGGYRGRRGGPQWELGHPLTEIWSNDQDVPPELVSLATDVLRRRQRSMQDAARNDRMNEREDASESVNDDGFLDASDGVEALPRLEGQQNLHFEWASAESFHGQEENFTPEHTGSVFVLNSAYDAFRSYWTDDVLDLIVAETNLHAIKIASASFQSEWFPTNRNEILCLFSFWMMLGIVRMPTVTSCFSVDPLLKTEVFRRMFTRKRYEMLNRALHFVDSDPAIIDPSTSNTGAGSFDRSHRLRPIITHLNSKFQSNYILSKDICIDESLTLWKGRLNFKQYIRNKASKFGIKTFELCESTTGYMWSFIVHTGKQTATELEESPGVLKSTAVVKKLIGPLLNKGYRLFMDNWYNSPLLARYLKLNGTDCVGTLRPSRRDVPFLINKAPLKRGEYIARHSGDVSVLAWQDKKRITMISTCHGSSCALPTVSSRPTSRPVPFKPQVVLDYDKFMRGVDTKDQMLEPYLLERKRCKKWYMKLFKRLINVSILNSRILLQSSTSKHHHHLAFRLELVNSILTNHLSHCPRSRRYTSSSSILTPHRYISSTHWPVLLEPTESNAARNRNTWKYCVVCISEGRKTQRTPYCCESCHVPLCIKNCFKSFHTKP